MKTVLSSINETIEKLEEKGFYDEADRLDKIFTKVAQGNIFEKIIDPLKRGLKYVSDTLTGKFIPPDPNTVEKISIPAGETLISMNRKLNLAPGTLEKINESAKVGAGSLINIPKGLKHPFK